MATAVPSFQLVPGTSVMTTIGAPPISTPAAEFLRDDRAHRCERGRHAVRPRDTAGFAGVDDGVARISQPESLEQMGHMSLTVLSLRKSASAISAFEGPRARWGQDIFSEGRGPPPRLGSDRVPSKHTFGPKTRCRLFVATAVAPPRSAATADRHGDDRERPRTGGTRRGRPKSVAAPMQNAWGGHQGARLSGSEAARSVGPEPGAEYGFA